MLVKFTVYLHFLNTLLYALHASSLHGARFCRCAAATRRVNLYELTFGATQHDAFFLQLLLRAPLVLFVLVWSAFASRLHSGDHLR